MNWGTSENPNWTGTENEKFNIFNKKLGESVTKKVEHTERQETVVAKRQSRGTGSHNQRNDTVKASINRMCRNYYKFWA